MSDFMGNYEGYGFGSDIATWFDLDGTNDPSNYHALIASVTRETNDAADAIYRVTLRAEQPAYQLNRQASVEQASGAGLQAMVLNSGSLVAGEAPANNQIDVQLFDIVGGAPVNNVASGRVTVRIRGSYTHEK